jgi:hypothetical protein
MTAERTFRRSELHTLVWSKAVQQVAAVRRIAWHWTPELTKTPKMTKVLVESGAPAQRPTSSEGALANREAGVSGASAGPPMHVGVFPR